MINLTESRIWNPTSNEIFNTYNKITSTQKIQIWIRVPDENTPYNGNYKRIRIEIPKGLDITRNFKEHSSGLYDTEYIIFKEKITNEIILQTKINDVTCIQIIDEK